MSATASVFAPPDASNAAPVLLQFYYQTGWQSAVLHFQQHLENGKLDWKDQTME
ncbi:Sucrose-6F-phosphate phosphohydrolase, partial [Toxoplasma gondii TgCatPRC2]